MNEKSVLRALKKKPGRYEALLQRLAEQMRKGPSQALKDYARVMVRFPGYSPYNQWLIAIQRPDATAVMGYRAWQKLGRQVKKGEKGIAILAPYITTEKQVVDGEEVEVREVKGFFTVYVFDYKQTEGEPLPEPPPPEGAPSIGFDQAKAALEAAGIPVRVVEDPTTEGWTDGRTIYVAHRRDERSMLTALIHEYAHYVLHFRRKEGEATPIVESRQRHELEAELAAYLAGALLGLEPTRASADYLLGYVKDPEQVFLAAPRAGKAVRKFLELVGKKAPAGKKEKEVALA